MTNEEVPSGFVNDKGFSMKKTPWKKVLSEVYNSSPSGYGIGKQGIHDNHDLAKKLKISGYELNQSLIFLNSHKLVQYSDNNWIELTERGFGVALENEKNQRDRVFSFLITYFTTILGATAVFEFMQKFDIIDKNILLVTYFILLIFIAFIFNRDDRFFRM